MKNIKNRINDKLFKQEETVELQSEKVELESIDQLKSDIKRMKKGISDLKALRKQMQKTYLNSIDGVSTNTGKFSQKANELGIKPNSVKEYNEAFDLQRELDDAYYAANKL